MQNDIKLYTVRGLAEVDKNVVEHEAAGYELEAGAAHNAKEGAESGLDGLVEVLAGKGEFCKEGAEYRTNENPDWGNKEAQQKAGQGSS